EVRGQNGTYSGWGFITVPYLADTKIKVGFENVQINTDFQLIAGVVETSYDASKFPEQRNIADEISQNTNQIEGLLNNWEGTPEQIEALSNLKKQYNELVSIIENSSSVPEKLKSKLAQSASNFNSAVDNLEKNKENATKDQVEQTKATAQKLNEDLKEAENSKSMQADSDTSIASDSYFDGVIAYKDLDQKIESFGENEKLVNLDDLKTKEADTTTVKEVSIKNNKKVYISYTTKESIIGDEKIDKIKQDFSNVGSNQFYLWLHYDTKHKQVKYKINFGATYFNDPSIERDALSQLYNEVLSFRLKEYIGSTIVSLTEATETFIKEYKTQLPLLDKELIHGITVFDALKFALTFTKNCGKSFQIQEGGIVPRCLWDDKIAGIPLPPQNAYSAGMIDGLWEGVEFGVDAFKFFAAWDFTSSFYSTAQAIDIRNKTIEVVLLLEQLYNQGELYTTIKELIEEELSNYLEETLALDAQARYNQGKLIFDIASLFFGYGEVKAALKTGKITSTTLNTLRNFPQNLNSLIKNIGKFSKNLAIRVNRATGDILIEGQKIARIMKDADKRIILAKEVFFESLDDNWQPIGELVTPEGYRFAMHDDRSISERVLSIVKDAQGKYRAGVKKLAEGVDDLLETTLSVLKKEFPNKWRYNKIGNDAYEIIDANGQKWGTLYSDRIVANGRTLKGAKGNPILNKVPLLKNMRYEVDGFVYLTDDLGRVVKTNADLDDIARVR
ncbi:MAG: hypothetical protein OIF50_07910, partial [Flavobacteriaceae bacterium]|nr:hypothetical protein [Flavobacteriaceae bacterium]